MEARSSVDGGADSFLSSAEIVVPGGQHFELERAGAIGACRGPFARSALQGQGDNRLPDRIVIRCLNDRT